MKKILLIALVFLSVKIQAQKLLVHQQGGNSQTNAVLPSQAGKNGKVLTTNGTNVSWGTVAGIQNGFGVGDSIASMPDDTTLIFKDFVPGWGLRKNAAGTTDTTYKPEADSFSVASRERVQKGMDSLGAVKQNVLTSSINGVVFNGSADATVYPDYLAYAALGSPILAETVNFPLGMCNTAVSLVDNQLKLQSVYLTKGATLTGVKVYMRTTGAYTGDNNNRVGLYSYSGGTLTLVASSANNSTLWTAANNGILTIPFSSTYAASSGLYYVAVMYNQSAQTTAPQIAGPIAINNLVMQSTAYGFANSAKLNGTVAAKNDLPSTQAMTGVTSATSVIYVALY